MGNDISNMTITLDGVLKYNIEVEINTGGDTPKPSEPASWSGKRKQEIDFPQEQGCTYTYKITDVNFKAPVFDDDDTMLKIVVSLGGGVGDTISKVMVRDANYPPPSSPSSAIPKTEREQELYDAMRETSGSFDQTELSNRFLITKLSTECVMGDLQKLDIKLYDLGTDGKVYVPAGQGLFYDDYRYTLVFVLFVYKDMTPGASSQELNFTTLPERRYKLKNSLTQEAPIPIIIVETPTFGALNFTSWDMVKRKKGSIYLS